MTVNKRRGFVQPPPLILALVSGPKSHCSVLHQNVVNGKILDSKLITLADSSMLRTFKGYFQTHFLAKF